MGVNGRFSAYGVVVLVAMGWVGSTRCAGAAAYNVVDLGPLGTNGQVTAINNQGVVVGYTKASSSADSKAFSYKNGVTTDLSGQLGSNSQARAINDNGDIAGSRAGPGTSSRGFAIIGGVVVAFPTFGGENSDAFGINNSGTVVGLASTSFTGPDAPHNHGFVWTDGNGNHVVNTGEMVDLPPLAGDVQSSAQAINAGGQIVGYSGEPGGNRAVIFVGGQPVNINAHPTLQTGAEDINDAGVATGYTGDAGHGYGGFVWDAVHGASSIGAIGISRAINEAGQTVGGFNNGDGIGYVWSEETGPRLLQDLIPTGSGWTLFGAEDINDAGQIVGKGSFGGTMHGYLLQPVPEPGLAWGLALGAAMIGRRRHFGRPAADVTSKRSA